MNIVSRFAIEKNSKYQADQSFRNNVNFILTFVSIIIFGVFAIRPSINTIAGLLREIEEYKKVNSILVEKVAILNEVNSNPEELEREKTLISRALPTTPDESTYIRNVNYIATRNNIQTSSVNFTVSHEGGLGALEFQLQISGNYPNVTQFLADFNKLLRITTIDEISISPEGELTQAVTATIAGKAYFITNTSLDSPGENQNEDTGGGE